MANDLYKALEVPSDASADAIKDAWRRIAKASHPDRNPGDDAAVARFLRASEAYEVLGDPSRRQVYDASLRAPRFQPLPWDGGAYVFRAAYQRRGGARRTAHAPPPSDRDVQAVRSGARSDDSILFVLVGVIGLGPVALTLAIVAAALLGPITLAGITGGLLLLFVVWLRRPRRRDRD